MGAIEVATEDGAVPDTDQLAAPRPPHPFPHEATPAAAFWLATFAWLGVVTGAVVFGWTLFGWAPAAAGGMNMGDQFELAQIQLSAWAGLGLALAAGLVLVLRPGRSAGHDDARRTPVVRGVKLASAAIVGTAGLATLVWGVTGKETRRDAAVTGQLRDTYWELISYAGLGAAVLAAIAAGRVLWAIRRR